MDCKIDSYVGSNISGSTDMTRGNQIYCIISWQMDKKIVIYIVNKITRYMDSMKGKQQDIKINR